MSGDVAPAEIEAFLDGRHADPHRLLAPRIVRRGDRAGALLRAWHPSAVAAEVVLDDRPDAAMQQLAPGLFEAFLPGEPAVPRHRQRFRFASGERWEREDPYRFPPTLGELDLHLFGEGRHWRLWEMLGAHPMCCDGVDGVRFAVWAPNARGASLVGDFSAWDARMLPMRALGTSGVFELFVPGVHAGALYKYVLTTSSGERREKTDPFARAMEHPPATASRVAVADHAWRDAEWLRRRAEDDLRRSPFATCEVHLGSFARVPEEDNRVLGYRELAPRLADHALGLGYTHLQLLPVMEHPYTPSWGYQVSGYFAPTARYGSPDDLRFFIDHCHERGIGVLLDWVPAHFPRDDWALRRFDGTPLYEHADPRRGEHPDWGTLIFDYGRPEVRNFLLASALYWLEEFHVDGLRVDAVASMLYLDYSREHGGWEPNPHGGRENLDAVAFLRELTGLVDERAPGAVTIAEESTAWPGVTRPVSEGGLGFTFKWNMGWMHDTLRYFGRDPVHRRWHQDELSFAMLYENDECFVNPLSHDEVVYGKGSLLAKLPGDERARLANLRAMLLYQWTRPGKPLTFMGAELGSPAEWNFDASLDWHLAELPSRRGLRRFCEDLGRLYAGHPCFWRWDHDAAGFAWISCEDAASSVYAYLRIDGDAHAVVVLNLAGEHRDDYRIGVPSRGAYAERMSSDADIYGGWSHPTRALPQTEPVPFHGFDQSVELTLPPLTGIVLTPLRP